MAFMLDTHTLLWYENGSNELSQNNINIILDKSEIKFLSIKSLWEIGIKLSIGMLKLKGNLNTLFHLIDNSDIKLLNDVLLISSLPLHHRNPFDRILIAQALSNNLILISKDTIFKNYKVKLLWDK